MENKVIIRLNTSNSLQTSLEGVKINKLVSSISPLNFIRLLKHADIKVNPRVAKKNSITENIQETLEISPELLWLKTKGILLATLSCKILERNRIEISFNEEEFEGIMDGGHNTLAIASFLIKRLFGIEIKKWDDCKAYWKENYKIIVDEFQKRKSEFLFSIPIEIISPTDEIDAVDEFYNSVAEICSARNNNVQLSDTTQANKEGKYDVLKEMLDNDFQVIWKMGDRGKIKPEDIVSIATIPLIFLTNEKLLITEKELNKTSIYSQKSKCVDFYNTILENKNVSDFTNGRYILQDSYIKSALTLTKDILIFFDKIYFNFPQLYSKKGRFDRIKYVESTESKALFYTTEKMCEYKYPFAYIYPLVAGLTTLMNVDRKRKLVLWKVDPNKLDLSNVDFSQYINMMKLVGFEPQKMGKSEAFYREAETLFKNVQL